MASNTPSMTTLQRYLTSLSTHSMVRFVCVGVMNTLTDFVVFFSLYTFMGFSVIPSNSIACSCAVTQSYFLHKYWSFVHPTSYTTSIKEFVSFVAVSLSSFFVGTIILVWGEPHIPILYLKIIVAGVVPVLNYISYRYLIFPVRGE